MNKEKYTEIAIDEFIEHYGAEYLFVNERLCESMVLRLSKQDATHHLSKYFQVNVRYLWMKSGLIKPKKRDKLLFEKGPKYIMSRITQVHENKLSRVLKKEKQITYKQNAGLYRRKLKYVERKFRTKYPFICGICEERKKNGMGFYTLCEEFFICDDCLKRYHIPLNFDYIKFISTPMGGQNKRY